MHPDNPVSVFQENFCQRADHSVDAWCRTSAGEYDNGFFHILIDFLLFDRVKVERFARITVFT
jgi:hypothetical protein